MVLKLKEGPNRFVDFGFGFGFGFKFRGNFLGDGGAALVLPLL